MNRMAGSEAWATMKASLVFMLSPPIEPKSRGLAQHLSAALFEYIEIFYNRRRHSSIGCRTRAQARMDMTMAQAA